MANDPTAVQPTIIHKYREIHFLSANPQVLDCLRDDNHVDMAARSKANPVSFIDSLSLKHLEGSRENQVFLFIGTDMHHGTFFRKAQNSYMEFDCRSLASGKGSVYAINFNGFDPRKDWPKLKDATIELLKKIFKKDDQNAKEEGLLRFKEEHPEEFELLRK